MQTKSTKPTLNKKCNLNKSLKTQNTILNASPNIIMPINLLNAVLLYFSCSSIDFVLKPAIRKAPLPFKCKIPKTINNKITHISTTIRQPPSSTNKKNATYLFHNLIRGTVRYATGETITKISAKRDLGV
jgi:hypothetical protein